MLQKIREMLRKSSQRKRCYGKICEMLRKSPERKRFYGKTCEKTRKYPNQNFPSNYKEKKVLLGEQIFRVIIRTYSFNYMCNSVEKKVFHAHFSQCRAPSYEKSFFLTNNFKNLKSVGLP
jgi:hypothetical protein